jgi:hypothetical protein
MGVVGETFLLMILLASRCPSVRFFDRSDFHDFYTIKSLWGGDFGVKISNI